MRRLLVAFASVAILLPALVLPAAAATKTIPPLAFRPLFNYRPDVFAIVSMPTVVGIVDSASPAARAVFWAQVQLPVGATITRVNYWYGDTEARGTKLTLKSTRWGTVTSELLAEITTSGTVADLVKISTTDITKPRVTAGEILLLNLELPKGSSCGGVKIDYVR